MYANGSVSAILESFAITLLVIFANTLPATLGRIGEAEVIIAGLHDWAVMPAV